MFLSVKVCDVALGTLSAQCVVLGGLIWQGETSVLTCARARPWDFPGHFFPRGISRLVEGRLVEGIKGRA